MNERLTELVIENAVLKDMKRLPERKNILKKDI